MVHDEEVAEKLAGEVFLRLHGSRDRFDRPDKVKTWLYRIAASLAISHADSVRSERAKGAEPAPVSAQQQEIAAQRRVSAICRHLDGLPERQRLAVILHKYQRFDYVQVAAVLGMSESATKALLLEAYDALRQRLGQFA